MHTVLVRIGSARFWSKLFESLLRWRPFGQMVAEVALWRLGPCWALSLPSKPPPGSNPAQRRHVLVVSSQAHSHKSTKAQTHKGTNAHIVSVHTHSIHKQRHQKQIRKRKKTFQCFPQTLTSPNQFSLVKEKKTNSLLTNGIALVIKTDTQRIM